MCVSRCSNHLKLPKKQTPLSLRGWRGSREPLLTLKISRLPLCREQKLGSLTRNTPRPSADPRTHSGDPPSFAARARLDSESSPVNAVQRPSFGVAATRECTGSFSRCGGDKRWREAGLVGRADRTRADAAWETHCPAESRTVALGHEKGTLDRVRTWLARQHRG